MNFNPVPGKRFSSVMGDEWEFAHVAKTALLTNGFHTMPVTVPVLYCRPRFSARNPFTWGVDWMEVEVT